MKKSEIATTPNGALKILWKAKFFFRPKMMPEIKKALEGQGYNFSDVALALALKRSKFLNRRGKFHSYTYVQIYPYVDNETISSE